MGIFGVCYPKGSWICHAWRCSQVVGFLIQIVTRVLKEGEIFSLIDFVENYSFKHQDEIQEQHWYNFQLSILVHITYQLNPTWNLLDPNSLRLITEYHYYIFDDRRHNNLFVQHAFNLHWGHWTTNGQFSKMHYMWNHGYANQFKGARSWFHVARYFRFTICPELPFGCMMWWNYWGTSHGKGPHDGACACLKQAIKKNNWNLEVKIFKMSMM